MLRAPKNPADPPTTTHTRVYDASLASVEKRDISRSHTENRAPPLPDSIPQNPSGQASPLLRAAKIPAARSQIRTINVAARRKRRGQSRGRAIKLNLISLRPPPANFAGAVINGGPGRADWPATALKNVSIPPAESKYRAAPPRQIGPSMKSRSVVAAFFRRRIVCRAGSPGILIGRRAMIASVPLALGRRNCGGPAVPFGGRTRGSAAAGRGFILFNKYLSGLEITKSGHKGPRRPLTRSARPRGCIYIQNSVSSRRIKNLK